MISDHQQADCEADDAADEDEADGFGVVFDQLFEGFWLKEHAYAGGEVINGNKFCEQDGHGRKVKS